MGCGAHPLPLAQGPRTGAFIGALPSWADMAAIGAWLALTLGGWELSRAFDFPLVRTQIAVATGAVVAFIVLAEAWRRSPESPMRGGALASLMALAAGLVTLA